MILSCGDWHQRYLIQARWTREVRRYLFDHLKAEKASRILEIGCGTGAILSDLALFSDAPLFGLDLQHSSLRFARQHLPPPVNLTCGNAFSLPFQTGSFDLVFCHFLLLWVNNPVAVLNEMRRVTQPGGCVLALAEPDYGGRIDYPDPLSRLGYFQAESLRNQGADPHLGRKLAGLLTAAGLGQVHAGLLGGHWERPPTADDLNSEWLLLEYDLANFLSANELQHLRHLDAAAWQNGERVLFVPTFYAWGFENSLPTNQAID